MQDSRWLKGDFTLDGMLAECRGDIAFLLLHVHKGLFTNAFLKCRFLKCLFRSEQMLLSF